MTSKSAIKYTWKKDNGIDSNTSNWNIKNNPSTESVKDMKIISQKSKLLDSFLWKKKLKLIDIRKITVKTIMYRIKKVIKKCYYLKIL